MTNNSSSWNWPSRWTRQFKASESRRSAKKSRPRSDTSLTSHRIGHLLLEELETRTLLTGHTLASATPIALSATPVTGILGQNADFYSVSVNSSGDLTAQVHAPALHTRLSLLSSSGQVIVQSDGQSPSNTDDQIDINVPGSSAGTQYFLEIQGLGGATGAYSLTANVPPTVPPFQSLPIGEDSDGHSFDLNGDGIPDLVTANLDSATLSVLIGQGDGTFAPPVAYFVGTPVIDVVAVALRDHGPMDLVAVSFTGAVTILPGLGNGTFGTATQLTTVAASTSIVAGDFNGDGHQDLAVCCSASNSVAVFLGNGDGTFAAPQNYTVGSRPDALITADFNHDGRLDLATANSTNSSISVLMGNGDGTFQSATTYAVGNSPNSLVAGDFLGNGRLDIAVANTSSNSVSILLNNGNGTFAPATSVAVAGGPTGIAAADFNGDEHLDLATTNPSTGTITVFDGRGDGSFQLQTTLTVGTAPNALVAADFNRDGHMDLAEIRPTNQIFIDLGLGNGTFQVLPTTVPSPGVARVAEGDFNGDGRLDLAISDRDSGTVQILLGRGDGTFQIGAQYATDGVAPLGIVVGDFNHDGILDLAIANIRSNTISIMFGRGDGTFSAPTLLATGNLPTDLVVGDFNGDGNLDLACVNNGDNTVSVFLGRGDGTFSPRVNYAVDPGPFFLVAGDLNGDGHLDLATLNNGSNDISILYGRGDGTFAPKEEISVPTAAVSPLGLAIVVADFNGDGIPDLAITTGAGISVFLGLSNGQGQPSGTFAPAVVYPDTDAASGLIAVKLNPAGYLDLVTADADGSLTILVGNGDGTFQLTTQGTVGKGPTAGVFGDFNGDGLPDLVTTNIDSNDVSVLLNNGNGTLRTQMRTAVPGGPQALLQTDLNDDGLTDLVTANFDNATISVSLGNGDGTFQLPVSVPVGNGPAALATGDFNGDGRNDLAVVNSLDGTVSILLGIGDGTFQSQQTYTVGQHPDAIVTGDFNGDGITDLAVANYASGTVTILFGRRNGTFGSRLTISVGAGPDTLAVADLNGNGIDDLIVGDYLAHDVRVLMGNGRGSFQVLAPVLLPAGPASVVTGDFNGDSVLDIAVACEATGGIFFLQGLGNGRFQAPRLVATLTAPVALVADDFNGDGHLDLAYADNNTNVVGVLQGLGNGTFVAQTPFAVSSYPFALVAGDFNNDARFDLATANGLGLPVSVALGLGTGSFVTVATGSPPFQSSPIVADFNGDGVPDIVVLRQNGEILFRPGLVGQPGVYGSPVVLNPDPANAVRNLAVGRIGTSTVLEGINTRTSSGVLYTFVGGQFVQIYSAPIPTALPSLLLGGDVNGDGRTDLIAASTATGQIFIGLQAASGVFADRAWDYQLQVNPGISSISLADLNGDGLPDLIVTNQTTGQIDVLVNSRTNPFSTQLVFQAGSGLAALEQGVGSSSVQSNDAPLAAVAGLFSGGTIPDLAILNSGADRIDLLVADGLGGVDNAAASLLTGVNPVALVTGDFNGDGHPDLAVLNRGSGTVSIFLGNGHGGFTVGETIGVGNNPLGLTAADINADGKVDLLVSNAQGDILLLFGNGDGTFQEYQRVDQHVALAVGDLTGAGNTDVIVANEAQDQLQLLSNSQGASFAQTRSNGVLAPNAVKLVDLTGNGILDLVVANGGGNNVLVYLGLGNGLFGPAHSFAVGTDPVAITVADLNGDGISDLVIANHGSNDISILYGQGEGGNWTLVEGPRLKAGYGPTSTAVADVNGDGIPDILVSNGDANTVYLLPGVGNGLFDDQHPTIYETGKDPIQVFVGHFDNSPGLDLVTVNAESNDLTFFAGFGTGRSIASGGVDPVAAVMGDFTHDGQSGLIVVNAGDNQVSLFLAGNDGPQIAATLTPGNLTNLSDAVLGTVVGNSVEIYLSGSGDAVTTLSFALDLTPVLPSNTDLLPSVPEAGVTEVTSLPEAPLSLVVTLAFGTPGVVDTSVPDTITSPSAAQGIVFAENVSGEVVAPAVFTQEFEARLDTIREVNEGNALPTNDEILPGTVNLNTFVSGLADIPPGQSLSSEDPSKSNSLVGSLPVPEFFDFSALPAPTRQGVENPGPIQEPEVQPIAPQEIENGMESSANELLSTDEWYASDVDIPSASIPSRVLGLALVLAQALVIPGPSLMPRRDKDSTSRRSKL